ncbi:MAG: hypothetical protein LBF68_03410 [Christensenellaceae bacterium]|jgi:hypothetical protein|nr:hypothetical protein [Christensenellaceae bacterium]
MLNLLLSIPVSLGANWWLYHLFLISLIIVIALLLRRSYKKTPLAEGKHHCNIAVKQLNKVLYAKDKRKMRMHLYAGKNYLISANNVFTQYIKDFGYNNLSEPIAFITEALNELDSILKDFSDKTIFDIEEKIKLIVDAIANSNINNLVVE